MTDLTTYHTVNSGSRITVSLGSVSHIIEHLNKNTENTDVLPSTCWIHFSSGKSVHVNESYIDVNYDLEEYHKTHH